MLLLLATTSGAARPKLIVDGLMVDSRSSGAARLSCLKRARLLQLFSST